MHQVVSDQLSYIQQVELLKVSLVTCYAEFFYTKVLLCTIVFCQKLALFIAY